MLLSDWDFLNKNISQDDQVCIHTYLYKCIEGCVHIYAQSKYTLQDKVYTSSDREGGSKEKVLFSLENLSLVD